MNYLIPLICTLVGIAGVIFSIIVAVMVKSAPAGDQKMTDIADAIKTGAIAYLNRQLKSMGIAGIILFVIIAFTLGLTTAVGFLVGAIASFAAGYIGMRVSVLANVRTAEAAKGGMAKGLSMAFRGGAVTGMIVAGLALTAVAGFYTILLASGVDARHAVIALVALGFGGSLISIFARLGGGIFTKGDQGNNVMGYGIVPGYGCQCQTGHYHTGNSTAFKGHRKSGPKPFSGCLCCSDIGDYRHPHTDISCKK